MVAQVFVRVLDGTTRCLAFEDAASLREGVAVASSSILSGPARVATGQLVTCILTARDGRGEALGFGGDKFLAAVRGPGHVASEIFDRGDGTYEVVLLAPPLSGEYSVSASLHGEQVGGAPHRLTVLAPRAHPPCCVVDGAGAELASAGDRAAFCVRAHDAHGNALTFGGDRIEVTMMVAADVPIATWAIASLVPPSKGSTTSNAGTTTKPPPMPKMPAAKPASRPAASIATSGTSQVVSSADITAPLSARVEPRAW